jgi:hypothetical protein
MELGAEKYSERNWERGMPIGKFLDSALRHTLQFLSGQRDEDHLVQGIFNLMGAVHTLELIERGLLPSDLNDLPNYSVPSPPSDASIANDCGGGVCVNVFDHLTRCGTIVRGGK